MDDQTAPPGAKEISFQVAVDYFAISTANENISRLEKLTKIINVTVWSDFSDAEISDAIALAVAKEVDLNIYRTGRISRTKKMVKALSQAT